METFFCPALFYIFFLAVNLIMIEKSIIFLHRLNILLDTNQVMDAFNYACIASFYYTKYLINNKKQIFFSKEDYFCIRDMYYSLLLKMNKKSDLYVIVSLLDIFY